MEITPPIRPRFPSDRPLVDSNNRMTSSWDYYFRNVQNQLPPPGEYMVSADNPVSVDTHGRGSIDFALNGATYIDGVLHIPQFTGDVTNNGVLMTLKSVGTPVTDAFVKVTTDAAGRVIGVTQVSTGDITSLVNGTYVNVTGDTMTGTLTVPSVVLDTGATVANPVAGQITWNATDHTADLKLNDNVTLQIGQESNVLVLNKSGSAFTDMQVVYITGAQGNRLTAELALANSDITSAATIGVVTEPIANNQQGFVTTSGLVRGIDTSAWAEGDQLYLSPTTPGAITNVKTTAPGHLVVIGWVVRSHAVNGSIYVHVNNGYELDELHNVLITDPAEGHVLSYDSLNALWINKPNAGGGSEVDGGFSASIYLSTQSIDGGTSE